MIIDAHTHVWPDSIAAKALAGSGLDLPLYGDGTAHGLLTSMGEGNIDRAVCLGVANGPHQVEKVNAFAAALPDRLIGFGSIHPVMEPTDAIESLRRHGLRGVKMHPIFQDYRIDDTRLLPILDAMRGEFLAIIHVGGAHGQTDDRASPASLQWLLRQLPGLDIIACHFGGYRLLDQAEEFLVGEQVYLDTSWPPSVATLPAERVRSLVRRHGTDRVVFASDWPTGDPSVEVQAIHDLGLGQEETEAILGGNLTHLLRMDEKV